MEPVEWLEAWLPALVLRMVVADRMVAAAVQGNRGLVKGRLVERRSAADVVGSRSLEPVVAETDWSNRMLADRTAGMDPWLEVVVLKWCMAKLGREVEHI